MKLLWVLLTTVLVALLLAVLVQSVENCTSPEDENEEERDERVAAFRAEVFNSVCAVSDRDGTGQSFRNQTRFNHGVITTGFHIDNYAPATLFSETTQFVRNPPTSCSVLRENVTWCVRIAYLDGNIETCVSIDDAQQLVFESTCDAQLLNLERHLSLPSLLDCGDAGSGCLGLKNLDWIFKDAYFTRIVKNESCSGVTFIRTLTSVNRNTPPKITQLTDSPIRTQPSETVVIRAEVTSPTAKAFVVWYDSSTSYDDHLQEDPYCDPNVEECRMDTHTDAPRKRLRRVRSYFFSRVSSTGCLGPDTYSLESYLIVDNATVSDSGNYTFRVTTNTFPPRTVQEDINVVIECDQTALFKTSCNSTTIVVETGDNIAWTCQFNAPPDSDFNVMHNKVVLSRLTVKDSLETICDKKPHVFYHLENETDHTCYNKFTVHVMVCAAGDGAVGDYSVVWGQNNFAEGSRVSVKLKPQSQATSGGDGESVPPVAYVVPVVVLVIALMGIGIVLVVLIRRRKRKRAHRGQLSQLQSPDPTVKDAMFYKTRTESGQFSPVSLLSPQGASVAYNDPLEFPRNQLYVYTHKVLGEGSFGRVLQAKAEGIVPGMPDRNVVAIKTTKENATIVETEELLAELYLMRNMEPHENILNLLGQCTTPGPVCLIVEFARYGNLRDFLRQCEEVVLSLNHKPHIPRNRSRTRTFSSSSFSSTQQLMFRQDSSVFTPGSGHNQFVFPLPSSPGINVRNGSSSSADSRQAAHHPNTAVPLAHTVTPIGHDYINSKGLVYMEDVHNFALQIACGLQHLAKMQIVHCDLAARNVLIAEGFVLKIADYGLARDISGREMYKKNPRGKIPVKWTAPEALENRVFTTKSDVWSYGVVLWELFTYGHTPYPDVHLSQSYEPIITYLKEGNRMAQPESCSDHFYELMQKCWVLDPDQRPTPDEIVATLTGTFQGVNVDIKEVVEEDLKTNGVKAK